MEVFIFILLFVLVLILILLHRSNRKYAEKISMLEQTLDMDVDISEVQELLKKQAEIIKLNATDMEKLNIQLAKEKKRNKKNAGEYNESIDELERILLLKEDEQKVEKTKVKEQFNKYEEELLHKNSQLKKIQKDKDIQSKELQKINTLYADTLKKHDNLLDQLDKKELELVNYKKTLNTTEKTLVEEKEKLKHTITDQLDKINDLEKSYSILKTESLNKTKTYKDNLERKNEEINQYKINNKNYTAKIMTLEKALSEKYNLVEELKNKSETQINLHTQKIEELKTTIETLEKEKEEIAIREQAIYNKVNKQDHIIFGLKQNIGNIEQSYEKLKDEYNEVLLVVDNEKNVSNKLREMLNKSEEKFIKEKEELQHNFTLSIEEEINKNNILETMIKEKEDTFKNENKILHDKITQYKEEITEVKKQSENNLEELKRKEKELEVENEEKIDLVHKLKALDVTIEEKNNFIQNEAKKTKKEIGILEDNIHELKNKIKSIEIIKEETEKKYKEIQKIHADKYDKLEDTLKHSLESNLILEKSIQQKEIENKKLLSAIEEAKQYYSNKIEKFGTGLDEAVKYKNEAYDQKAIILTMEQTIKHKDNIIAKQEEEFSQLIKDMNYQQEQIENEFKQIKSDKKMLQKKYDEMKDKVILLDNKLEEQKKKKVLFDISEQEKILNAIATGESKKSIAKKLNIPVKRVELIIKFSKIQKKNKHSSL